MPDRVGDQKFSSRALEADPSCFQDKAVVGHAKGHLGILLDEENGYAGPLDLGDDLGDLLGHEGNQAQRKFAQEHEVGFGHEAAPDGQHLLLSPAQASRFSAAVPPGWGSGLIPVKNLSGSRMEQTGYCLQGS